MYVAKIIINIHLVNHLTLCLYVISQQQKYTCLTIIRLNLNRRIPERNFIFIKCSHMTCIITVHSSSDTAMCFGYLKRVKCFYIDFIYCICMQTLYLLHAYTYISLAFTSCLSNCKCSSCTSQCWTCWIHHMVILISL